jgi:uncharacterized protein YidB (DUF937 family)
MGILDGVLGGLVSAGVTALVSNVLEKNGGVQGLVSQFEQKGLGAMVQSWVGTGANQAVEPAQIEHALGGNMLEELAAKAGISKDDIAAQLANLLPEAVDKLTPNGVIAQAA